MAWWRIKFGRKPNPGLRPGNPFGLWLKNQVFDSLGISGLRFGAKFLNKPGLWVSFQQKRAPGWLTGLRNSRNPKPI